MWTEGRTPGAAAHGGQGARGHRREPLMVLAVLALSGGSCNGSCSGRCNCRMWVRRARGPGPGPADPTRRHDERPDVRRRPAGLSKPADNVGERAASVHSGLPGCPTADLRSLGPPPRRGSDTDARWCLPWRAQATRQVARRPDMSPGHHPGKPIVAVGGGQILDEALQAEHCPGRDLLRANPARRR
jgi:hypothetical protein